MKNLKRTETKLYVYRTRTEHEPNFLKVLRARSEQNPYHHRIRTQSQNLGFLSISNHSRLGWSLYEPLEIAGVSLLQYGMDASSVTNSVKALKNVISDGQKEKNVTSIYGTLPFSTKILVMPLATKDGHDMLRHNIAVRRSAVYNSKIDKY